MNPYTSTTMDYGEEPDNTVEVDLEKYPPPKDSTSKIRGKQELMETLVGGLEPELVTAKGFYFFFFAAFGSLFPLMGVYFKQLGFNPAQAGILSGIRPLIEFIAAPLWVSFAERTNRTKVLLLASLISWIIFTFPIGSIQPEPVACLRSNKSHLILTKPEGEATYRRRREISSESDVLLPVVFQNDDGTFSPQQSQQQDYAHEYYLDNSEFLPPVALPLAAAAEELTVNENDADDGYRVDPIILRRVKRKIPKYPRGMTPNKINEFYVGYEPEKMKNWVSPSYSNLVFTKDDVGKVFFLLLLIVVIGESCSCPAIMLADSAVMNFLGDEAPARYGHQRMFGSLGWAVSMFFIGIALDQSKFPTKKCELAQEKNYTVCFSIFVVLMGLATILAWRLKLPTPEVHIELMEKEQQQPVMQSHTGETGIPHTTVFAQQSRRLEYLSVFKEFKTVKSAAFLGVAWIMGVGIGIIFTFLFWHLQEIGGSPTLFGLASVINHVSEIFAYFFSSTFISQLGHVKVLCLGLGCNVLRFLYISVLSNPWWVLPFEFVQGLTHAAVWAACSSYLAHSTPVALRPPAQSLLHFIHHGLGRGFGAIVGGLLISKYGTESTFRLYALLCAAALAGFGFLNYYRPGEGFIRELPQEEDPREVAEETSHLAPHGVPGGLPRVSSNVRLEDQSGLQQQPQMSQGTGNFNPFNQQQQQQQNQGDTNQYFVR